METNPERERWSRDAEVLGDVGLVLDAQGPLTVEARLPRDLIEQAIAAWRREPGPGVDLSGETRDQARTRQRSGALALIGLELSEQSIEPGELARVRLPAHLVGDALRAAWGED